MTHLRSALIFATLAATAPFASAALPDAYLTFAEPTGTVGPNDVIDVKAIFTLDEYSAPFDFGNIDLSSFDLADLPLTGYNSSSQDVEFAEYSYIYLYSGYTCSGSFFKANTCSGTSYTTSFPGGDAVTPLNTDAALEPGESIEFTMVRFTPVVGGALPGTYTFQRLNIGLSVHGLDIDGNEISADISLASTCSRFSTGDCGFSRTVVTQVPEPSAYASIAAGLGVLAWVGMRRKNKAARPSHPRAA